MDVGSSDTSVDQTNDVVSVDGGMGTDAISDADAGSLCPYTGGNPGCFGAACTGAGLVCCLHDSGPECGLACTGIELACTSPSECTSDAAPNCCLSASFSGLAGCPVLLGPGTMMTGSSCSSAFCSAPLQGKARVCTTNADCPGANKCVQAAFASNPTNVFGVCE